MIASAHGVAKPKLGWFGLAVLAGAAVLGLAATVCRAEPPSSGTGAAENWPTSPYHGVMDGDGRVIPCRCRYRGQEYRLGEVVCMQTPRGTVLTRCDLFMNNTSWIPTADACTISRAADPVSLAVR